jgi:hypothetical protein
MTVLFALIVHWSPLTADAAVAGGPLGDDADAESGC